MAIRRAALAAVVVAVVILSMGRHPSDPPPPPSIPAAPQVSVPARSLPPEASRVEDPEQWRARAELLSERCDVDTHTICSGAACASVAWLPDLDSLRGWASLGWHNPGLFAVSVLGDVGLEPPGGWPCNDAIRSFFSGIALDVGIGDGPQGTWVVCAATGGDPTTTGPLCTTAAAALGLPFTGTDPARHL